MTRRPSKATRKAPARPRKKRRSRRSLTLSRYFGLVLTRLRKNHALTIEDLVRKSGVPLSRVIGLEKGAREPNIQDLFLLSTALGVLASEFMYLMDAQEKKEMRS